MFTARDIEDRMEEAALTLRRLPNPPGSGAKGYGSSWPDYVRDQRHAYGYHEARMRVVPSAAEIGRMEECIAWLTLIDYRGEPERTAEDRRIVWLRAEGERWKAVCIAVGCVRQTAWRRWVAALQTIANRLNKQAKKPRDPAPRKTDRAEQKQSEAPKRRRRAQ